MCTKDSIELLKKPGTYNPELKMADWQVLNHVAEPQSIHMTFEVNVVSS